MQYKIEAYQNIYLQDGGKESPADLIVEDAEDCELHHSNEILCVKRKTDKFIINLSKFSYVKIQQQ